MRLYVWTSRRIGQVKEGDEIVGSETQRKSCEEQNGASIRRSALPNSLR